MPKKMTRLFAIVLFVFALSACAGSSHVQWGRARFRSEPDIRVRITGRQGRGSVVRIPIETYLTGVIGHEMSPGWPVEALKAQTVAARSYALYRMTQSRAEGRSYDVVDSQGDQVYRDAGRSTSYLKGIVNQTRGEVVWKSGRIVEAFFSSTCGGRSESARAAGLAADSPLNMCRSDKYCESSPFRSWSFAVDGKEVARRLKRAGYRFQNVESVKVAKRNPSGYAHTVMVSGGGRRETISAKTFRNLMGNMRFKSLLFDVEKGAKDRFVFTGNGFGHGVGLCQYGAKEMAAERRNYQQILKQYYVGTELRRIYR